MSTSQAYSKFANGNIYPSRFVKLDSTAEGTVLQATDGSSSHGDFVFGVSQAGTRIVPSDIVANTAYAAMANEELKVFGPLSQCFLELGTGGATIGARLKSDANGKGIAVSADLDNVGAIALEDGNAGDVIQVQVYMFTHGQ